MFVTRSFSGLIMLVVMSSAQPHPGNPADGTCLDCTGVMYENAVWYSECTEEFTCPSGIADIEDRIKGKERRFHEAYYFGNGAFIPGTRHYVYDSILEKRINSMNEGDIGTLEVPTDDCQHCEADLIGDAWVQFICEIVTCPPLIAEHIELRPPVPEEVATRDRICLVRKDNKKTIYTCEYYSDDPNLVDHVIEDAED